MKSGKPCGPGRLLTLGRIARSDRDGSPGSIVRMVLALAENMGVSVVAEGVETADELAFLKELNCRHAQGYLFSRPISPDELTPLIGSHRYDV